MMTALIDLLETIDEYFPLAAEDPRHHSITRDRETGNPVLNIWVGEKLHRAHIEKDDFRKNTGVLVHEIKHKFALDTAVDGEEIS